MTLASLASWKRYLTFCGVGFSGLLVDLGLFHLLHTQVGWPLESSKVVAAETALLNNFLWNDRWTFENRPQGSSAPWPRRLLRFHLICLSGIVLTLVLLGLLHRGAGFPVERSNAMAIVAVSVWNFVWSRRWGWSVSTTPAMLSNKSGKDSDPDTRPPVP
jgi:dolichol-phosphate mannosyltransferase